MKKRSEKRSRVKAILLTLAAVFFIVIVLIPISLTIFDGAKIGNVALIPIEGTIMGSGDSYFGQSIASSSRIVEYIKKADKDKHVKVILLEINSPGGSAVASDEIAAAIKRSSKPVVSLIREVGASGGYWIASASDWSIANRMSITGSIGVVSSYLEFSGLMEKYGVGYERLVAGESKDLGVPFKKLDEEEKAILQKKINKIHDFFITEIAGNRGLSEDKVRELATGEFYLGVEALQHGLIDQIGDKDIAEAYIKETYGLEEIDYVVYRKEVGFFDILAGVFSDFSFNMGRGAGSIFVEGEQKLMLI